MIGCSNGFEAWRRIHRRWDPLTAGRTRNILRAILNPERVKRWEDVRAAIEQLEDLFRRYENRKNEAGERERLSEDIKATSLELLVPSDIERHLLLNKGRLATYAQMKSEIDLVIESSLGSKAPISRPGAASSSDSGPAPMDVDSLTKVINSLVKGKGSGGKGKNTGKGKDKGSGGKGSTFKDIVCFNCGKAGRKAGECWSKKKDGSNKGSSKGSKGGGKKGKSKGKRKGANSLEEDTGEGAPCEGMDSGVPGEGCLQLPPEGEGTYSGFWAAAHSGVSPPEGRPEGVPEREEETCVGARTSEPDKGGGGRA